MTNNFGRLAITAVAAGFLALPAFAQSSDWRVDSDHSAARIGIQSRSSDESSLALGAAAASGILRIDNGDISNSALQFDLYPASSSASADGPAETTRLTFRSETASMTPDGNLKVTGVLTLSRILRQVVLDGNEGYSGPVEVSRVAYQSSREESLIIPISLPSRKDRGNSSVDLTSSLNIVAEDFPGLVEELLATNWPALAQDRTSEPLPPASESYTGALNTGASVETRSVNRVVTTTSEDYSGGEPILARPANIVTVALQLRLVQQPAQLSATAGQ